MQEGIPISKRAIELKEKYFGLNHLDVAESINILADFYFDEGKFEESNTLYERAFSIRK